MATSRATLSTMHHPGEKAPPDEPPGSGQEPGLRPLDRHRPGIEEVAAAIRPGRAVEKKLDGLECHEIARRDHHRGERHALALAGHELDGDVHVDVPDRA